MDNLNILKQELKNLANKLFHADWEKLDLEQENITLCASMISHINLMAERSELRVYRMKLGFKRWRRRARAKSRIQKVVHIYHSGKIHAFDPNSPIIYRDRVLENIVTHDLEVFYDGQDLGREDHHLVNSINEFNAGRNVLIKFYMRQTNLGRFTYMGEVSEIQRIQIRSTPINTRTNTEERMKVHFVIKRANRRHIEIPIVPDLLNTGVGCYINLVFYDLGIIEYNLIPDPKKPGFNKSPIICENFNDDDKNVSIKNILCKPQIGFGVFLKMTSEVE